MKAILLLTAFLVSIAPIKATDNLELKQKQAYFYGFVYGSGTALCGALEDKQITKEYVQYFLPELVKELSKHPESEDIIPSLNKARENAINSDVCKGVFE